MLGAAIERKPKIEQVNKDGGRLIREAKVRIWDFVWMREILGKKKRKLKNKERVCESVKYVKRESLMLFKIQNLGWVEK